MKNKKIFVDISLNLAGSFLLTGLTQIVMYPVISSQVGSNTLGTVLTITGIINALGVVFGGTLNNIRLINNNIYTKENIQGDYKLLSLFGQIISAILAVSISLLFKSQLSWGELFTIPVITMLVMMRSYLNVYYRIELDYSKIFYQLLAVCIGYVVSIPVFFYFQFWPIIFIIGEITGFMYSLKTTEYLKEPLVKTIMFKKTLKESLQLGSSNLIYNLLLYLDRLIINPLMGAEIVSVYFVASFIGKMLGVIFQPISGVILSYISKSDNNSGKKLFGSIVIVGIFIGLVSIFLSEGLSLIVINYLYPDLIDAASPYFFIANLGASLGIIGSLFQPVALKYCPMIWQTIIQSVYFIVYVILALVLVHFNGLFGFCLAVVMSNSVRMILYFAVSFKYIIQEEHN
jgi:O-antigen/teichoic acid export membrane protein